MLGNQAFACTPAKKSLKLSSVMNTKRLILAIVVAFVVLWVTDFLIHGVWMMSDYRSTQQLWRTDAAMGSRMGWMLGAQLLFAITFVLLWTRWAETARLGCAIGYGCLWVSFREPGLSSCMSSFLCRDPSPPNGSLPTSCKQSCLASSPFLFTSPKPAAVKM